MKIFNFCLFLWTVGVFYVSGQKDSSESKKASKGSTDKAKNESDFEQMEKNVKHDQQRFLITPDEGLLISQRLLKNHKPGFLDEDGYLSLVTRPIGSRKQNVHLLDDTGSYNVQLENFQNERPTHFQTALGAISTHVINQKNQEYIPYPPNGDPYNYPAYRGHPHATEPPVIRAYERSTGSNYNVPPLVDFSQQNPRRVFANDVYQRTFSELENFGPGFYSNSFNADAAEQLRNSEQINKWFQDQRGQYRAEEVF